MPHTSTITCRDFVASIDEYQGGEMPPRRRAHFDDHLSQCEMCSAYLKSYISAVKLAKDAYDAESEDAPDDLVRSIMVSHAKKRSQ